MAILSIKVIVFCLSLIPLISLSAGVLTHSLGANPIEVLTCDTGLWALRFLLLTLAVSPIVFFTRSQAIVSIRRMLGLYSFFYASIHMLLYLWLDQFFDFKAIIDDIIERPFITVGLASFLALIPLAATSNRYMIEKLGSQKWKSLHKLVYYIAIGGAVHFFMLVKQDKLEPLIYMAILFALLAFRLVRYFQRSSISTKPWSQGNSK
jgi:sulfoxide reductase heme-binding subunit YedZ